MHTSESLLTQTIELRSATEAFYLSLSNFPNLIKSPEDQASATLLYSAVQKIYASLQDVPTENEALLSYANNFINPSIFVLYQCTKDSLKKIIILLENSKPAAQNFAEKLYIFIQKCKHFLQNGNTKTLIDQTILESAAQATNRIVEEIESATK